MLIVEIFLGLVVGCSTLFPIIYIFSKNGQHRLFFISSCIGAYVSITLLLWVIAMPVSLFLIKVVPSVADHANQQGQTLNVALLLFLRSAEFVRNWWFFNLHPILLIYLPLTIYRNFSFFRSAAGPNQGAAQA